MSTSENLLEYDPIEDYTQQKLDGRDYSDIRNELSEKGHTQDEIKEIMYEIDNRLLDLVHQPKPKKTFFSTTVIVGIASLIVAIVGIKWLITMPLGFIPLIILGFLILKALLRISSISRKNIRNRKRYMGSRPYKKI